MSTILQFSLLFMNHFSPDIDENVRHGEYGRVGIEGAA